MRKGLRMRKIGLSISASAALVVAVVMLGCGGGGTTTSASQPAAGTSPSGGSAPTARIAVAETQGTPAAFIGFGVANGIFRRHGLDVKVQPTEGGAAIIPALVSGSVQFGGGNVMSYLLASQKGLPVEVVAPGTSSHERGDTDFVSLIVKKGGDIRSPKDLEGKTVALNTLNDLAHLAIVHELDQRGVDVSKVKFTEIPFPEMPVAVAKGQVAGAVVIEPFQTAGIHQGAKILLQPFEALRSGLQVGVYATTRQYAQANPEIVKRFAAAVGETARYEQHHQAAFRKYLSQRAKIPAAVAESIVLPVWKPSNDPASIAEVARLIKRYGFSQSAPDAAKLLGGG